MEEATNSIVCRTCLTVVKNENAFTSLDFIMETYGASIGEMLQACISEVDLSVSEKAVICNVCLALLTTTYEFKVKCLSTEEKIFDYKQKNKLPIVAKVNLCDVSISSDDTKTGEEYYLDENNEIQPLLNIRIKRENLLVLNEDSSTEQIVFNDSSSAVENIVILEEDLGISLNIQTPQVVTEFPLTREVAGFPVIDCADTYGDSDKASVIIVSSESEDESDVDNGQQKSHDRIEKNGKDMPSFDANQCRENIRHLNCMDCGKKFKRRKHYGQHYFTHRGEFPFSCDLCPFSAVYRSQLRRHKDEHSPHNFHVCPLCHKSFANSLFLCDHLKGHEDPGYAVYPSLPAPDRSATEEAYRECSKCREGFFREADKAMHARWHALQRHMTLPEVRKLAHAQSGNGLKLKIYSCGYCRYSTTVPYDLKYHMGAHLL